MALLSLEISEKEYNELTELLIESPSPYVDSQSFFKFIEGKDKYLPHRLIIALDELKYNFSPLTGVLIKNLPVGNQENIPPKNCSSVPSKYNFISEAITAVIASRVGYIFGYKQERDGHIIQNIVPEVGREYINSSEGSAVPLELHVDNGYLDCYPDHVGLFCLIGDTNGVAKTSVFEASTLLSVLSPASIEQLYTASFCIRFSYSFSKKLTDEEWSIPRPIFTGKFDNPQIRVKFGVTKGINSRAQSALDELIAKSCDENLAYSVNLEKGDLIILSNKRAIHGRSKFQAQFNRNDRWLHRVYTFSDPWIWREYFQKDNRVLNFN